MLKIIRKRAYASSLDSFKIFCDDKKVGTIKQGETLEVDLPRGDHEIYLKVFWCRSPKIRILEQEHNVSLSCVTNLTGLRVFLALLYITFLRHRYIKIEKLVD